MKLWMPFFLIILLISCKDFDLKKQSADQILEEELKTINWKEVDFYPTFQSCGVITSKQESKTCFETEIKNAVRNKLSEHHLKTSIQTQDTLILELFISAKGEASIKNFKISNQISIQNPELDNWMGEIISQLPEIYPAQKRSVPVSITTKLPIILK